MQAIATLQRQHEAVRSIGRELRQSLDRIESDYRTKIDGATGRRAPDIQDASGMIPFIYGLEWALRDETWAVIANSKRLIQTMEQLAIDVTQGLPMAAFADVPQDSWARYIALCDKYTAQREEWRKTLKQIEKVWYEEVSPHLDPSKHKSD